MDEPLHRVEPMTIDTFLAFVEGRPDDERWELVDGHAVMNATPADRHQVIVGNLLVALVTHRRREGSPWLPMLGIGTRALGLDDQLLVPDLFVRRQSVTGAVVSDEALVVFEVLSPSNRRRDRERRLATYQKVQGAEHYVVVRQDRVEATRYDRSAGWLPTVYGALDKALDLPALALAIPLAEIYADTHLG